MNESILVLLRVVELDDNLGLISAKKNSAFEGAGVSEATRAVGLSVYFVIVGIQVSNFTRGLECCDSHALRMSFEIAAV